MSIIYNIGYIADNLLAAWYDEKEDVTNIFFTDGLDPLTLPGFQMDDIMDAAHKSDNTFIIDDDEISEDKYANDEEENDEEKDDTDLLNGKVNKTEKETLDELIDQFIKCFTK